LLAVEVVACCGSIWDSLLVYVLSDVGETGLGIMFTRGNICSKNSGLMHVGLVAQSSWSLVTQQKSLREAASLSPARLGEDCAMIFFDREIGRHQETAKNENVLHLPTAYVLVFFLTFLYVDVSTGGGG
jgi:hypothetical protein